MKAAQPWLPRVTVRESSDTNVTVEFMFPNGKGGLMQFSNRVYDADDRKKDQPHIYFYRTDGGIQISLPTNVPLHGDTTTEPV
jgi:hypothetical protein